MGLGALLGVLLAVVPVAVQVYEASAREQELEQHKVEFEEQKRQFEVEQAQRSSSRELELRLQGRAIIRDKLVLLEAEIHRADALAADNETRGHIEVARVYRQRAISAFLRDDLAEADVCIRTADVALQGWYERLANCEDTVAKLLQDNAALKTIINERAHYNSEAKTPLPGPVLWVSAALLLVRVWRGRPRAHLVKFHQ